MSFYSYIMAIATSRALTTYFAEINVTPRLTRAEQVRLLSAYRTCPKAGCGYAYGLDETFPDCPRCKTKRNYTPRDIIVKSALRFVVKQAIKYAKRAKISDDSDEVILALIAAGNEGLMIAVDRFDTHKEVRFLTYATHWVKERMLFELDHMGTVHVPAYLQKEVRLRRRMGDESEASRLPVSVEGFTETNEVDKNYALEKAVMNSEGASMIYAAMTELNFDTQERYVITAYFGLREDARNLGQIGTRLQIPVAKVHQIKDAAIDRLTKYFQKRKKLSAAEEVFEE